MIRSRILHEQPKSTQLRDGGGRGQQRPRRLTRLGPGSRPGQVWDDALQSGEIGDVDRQVGHVDRIGHFAEIDEEGRSREAPGIGLGRFSQTKDQQREGGPDDQVAETETRGQSDPQKGGA